MPGVDLDASRAHCRRVARRAARNFYYGFFPLFREQHNAMCAVYAFARHSDDIADEESGFVGRPPRAAAGPPAGFGSDSVSARRDALQRWRKATEAALTGTYGDNPILPALHEAIQRFKIPPRYFFELVEGVETDLNPPCYQTFDELYRYCYLVASTIGLICLHIFGFESEQAPALAEKMGIAFQLTNILRDLREDADRGRLYLPAEDLQRFGADRRDLQAGKLDRVRDLLRFEADRAEAYYREATPLFSLVHRRSRASLWILAAIYHGILHRMRDRNYDVFSRRTNLSHAEKTAILLRGLKLHLVGGEIELRN